VSTLAPILARTPVTQIGDVVARLQEIEAALLPTDGIACWNKLYLAVTNDVIAAEQAGLFSRNQFISTLDIAFGNLYFDALRALESPAPVPRAWTPLFDARARADIAPIQFALAGMNAHINRDLPVGIVAAFETLTIDLARPSPESLDYDKVNDVLARTEANIAQSYFTPLMKTLDRDFDGVDDIVANWSVRAARASAWSNATILWHLRARPELSKDYLEALDRTIGFAGRGLLIPA
jgi:hypothetical protein